MKTIWRRSIMRRTTHLAGGLGVAAIVTLLLPLWSGSSGVVPQVFASNGCLASDLNGSYSALYQGWNIVPKGYALGREPYIGFAGLIVVSFDGSNGISGGAGAVQLGVFNRSFDITEGTYFLDTDCTGTLTFETSDGVRWHHRIHVTGSGEEYQFLRLQNPGFDVELLQFGTARRMD
jgi:hypothetical protein